ncbi:MAG: phosphomevalonate decarboxylase [Thermoplasmata archaeon]|jgi:phosphomevalonate decarboxylase|nr:phosphomevalonate decarboxylase [Thermoplasmata archaeon]
MTAGKASAIAYPIQGLVKYHGLKDPVRRIPYHDSISLCTGPIHTHTTLEVLDQGPSQVEIDGKPVTGRPLERVRVVVDAVREKAGDDRSFRLVSRNDFPQYVGLGSSSSGFAALALAAAAAYGWKAGAEELSEVARLGAGSASRAVTGGVSEWVNRGARSFARMLAAPEDLADWRIVVPLVQHEEPTENVHAEVVSSPFFAPRNQYVEGALSEMRRAVAAHDLAGIHAIAERDTLNLHAVTMTAQSGHITWMPATLEAMHRVRRLRRDGVPVWFSIDTGATAYLNTTAAHEERVAAAMEGIPGVARLLRLRPAGPARLVPDHLF